MTNKPLSLFSRLAATSAQQAEQGYAEAIISALRNKEDVKLAEAKKKDNPSLAPSSELPYVIREVSDNEIQTESTPQGRPMTRYESRSSSYSWPTILSSHPTMSQYSARASPSMPSTSSLLVKVLPPAAGVFPSPSTAAF